jgi:hypothetical protein
MEEIGIKPAQSTKVNLILFNNHLRFCSLPPPFACSYAVHYCQVGAAAVDEEPEDLYVNYKQLQRHLEFLQVQEDYIKV